MQVSVRREIPNQRWSLEQFSYNSKGWDKRGEKFTRLVAGSSPGDLSYLVTELPIFVQNELVAKTEVSSLPLDTRILNCLGELKGQVLGNCSLVSPV